MCCFKEYLYEECYPYSEDIINKLYTVIINKLTCRVDD